MGEKYSQRQFDAVFRQYDDLTNTKGFDETQTKWMLGSMFSSVPGLVNWFFDKLKSQEYLDDEES